MGCKIEKASNGKINKILDQSGNKSKLFQQILNIPTLSLNDAIDVYKNVYNKKIQDKIKFQVIGEKASSRNINYNQKLNEAKDLEKQGKSIDEISQATGWYKSKDGWKYLSKEIVEEFKIINSEPNKELTLTQVLGNENKIFQFYPEMQEIKVVFYDKTAPNYEKLQSLSEDSYGDFIADSQTIRISTMDEKGRRTLQEMQNTLGHEVSHYGAKLERFSKGGNLQTILDETVRLLNIKEGGKRLSEIAQEIKNADKSKLTTEQFKVVDKSLETISALMRGDKAVLYNQYKHILGEIDANIVGQLTEKNKVVGTYGDLLSLYINNQNIDPNSIFLIGGGEVEFQIIGEKDNKTASQITQELIDRLKLNGLAKKVTQLTTQEIDAKLKELGISDDVRKQVIAYHGSPYFFDRFTTNAMGTGEGAQAFGWGLYFTDLEDIARRYAKELEPQFLNLEVTDKNLSDSQKLEALSNFDVTFTPKNSDFYYKIFLSSENGIGIEQTENNGRLTQTRYVQEFEELYNEINDFFEEKFDFDLLYIEGKYTDGFYKNGIPIQKTTKLNNKGNQNILYKVSLHKKKTPSEYNYLENDKIVKKDIIDKVKERLKTEGFNNISDRIANNVTGENLYEILTRVGKGKENPYKEASLFLLRAGIDGIKYPAESISRGATSDTARGFNYVVFDENAITIEEQIQFQKQLSDKGITLTTNGFTVNNEIFLNSDTADDSTLLHEYQHIFNSWLKENRKETYNKGISLIEDELAKENSEIQDVIDFVKRNQPSLTGERFKEELLTEFVGRYSKQMMDDQKSKSPLIQWLSDFWDSIAKILNLSDYTPEQVANMTLADFAKSSVSELLSGEDLNEIKLTYNEQGQHLAPNGKPSNLTEQQANQIRTQNFKNWFGNWENDAENASKVVDENGEPLVVYHGTDKFFTVFDTTEEGELGRKSNVWDAEYPDGYVFMTSSLKDSNYYGSNLMPLFVSLRYPTIKKVKKGDSLVKPFDDKGLAFEGDAIVTDGETMIVGTLDEYQIKSATENTGEFSNNSNDIRYQIIGEQGASNVIKYNDSLNQAKELEKQGLSYSEIENKTGWYKFKGQWRTMPKEVLESFEIVNNTKDKILTLKEVIGDSNTLFDFYPEISDTKVVFLDKGVQGLETPQGFENSNGAYNETSRVILINTVSKKTELGKKQQKYTLGHELQHRIQQIEVQPKGGSRESLLNEAIEILSIQSDNLQDVYNEIQQADKSGLTKNEKLIVDASLNTILAIVNQDTNFLKNQYKHLLGEIDANIVEGALKIKDNQNVIVKSYSELLNFYSQFQKIDLNNIYLLKNGSIRFSIKDNRRVIEPNLTFETLNGETFDNYKDALKNTDYGIIKANIEDLNIAEINSDTNIDVYEGIINHLVKSGGLTGERILDVNGDIIHVTEGQSQTAKYFTAELVETQARKLLGATGVKMNKNGDFIFTNNLNKVTIKGEQFNAKEIDELNLEQLEKKFDRETALEIQIGREYSKAIQPTKTRKRLEQITELKTEDELTIAIKNLLNKLGIKITSIDDYIKNNTLKNNDVAPEATALMDLVNKVMAFKDGTITREDLIEETMHLIEASLDPKLTEGVRRNISKTAEWKQYSETYFNIYSKEYSGDKLDEMVRREILGKVMANAVINNFALSENATLVEQSVFNKIKEFLQGFFDTINNFFKPQYLTEIDNLNNDIFAKLMAGTLSNELNTEQEYGTKFRLYSTSNDVSNPIVRLQKEAERALEILRINTNQIAKSDSSQSTMSKAVRQLIDSVSRESDNSATTLESIATFSKIINMVQKQTRYLERALAKAGANKMPFSAEEMIVYRNLLDQFQNSILPVVKEIISTQEKTLTANDKKMLQELEKAQSDISNLVGAVKNNGFDPKNYVLDLLIKSTNVDAKTEEFLRQKLNGVQAETNFFFHSFGNLAHASNTMLGALGKVITRTVYERDASFQDDSKPFVDALSKLGILEKNTLAKLVNGNFLNSVYDFDKITKSYNEKRYELYFEILGNKESKFTKLAKTDDGYDKSVSDFIEDINFVGFSEEEVAEYARRIDVWKIEEYKLSALKSNFTKLKREKLSTLNISEATQQYERDSSAEYASIMKDAEYASITIDGEIVKIPLITEDMKVRFQQEKKTRNEQKRIEDKDGKEKEGITVVTKDKKGAIQIGENLFVLFDPSKANKDSLLSFELNKIDFNRSEEFKAKGVQNGMTKKFEQMFLTLEGKEAYDFMMLNAYVGFTQEYYDSFNENETLIKKLEKSITPENKGDVEGLIKNINKVNRRMSNIIKANKEMNNPAEVNFDEMEGSETTFVKEYSQDLENLYYQAKKYLKKEDYKEFDKGVSETKVNNAFAKYIYDTVRVQQLNFSDFDVLEEDQYEKIDLIFSEVIKHTTENKRAELTELKRDIRGFSEYGVPKLSKGQQRAFQLTADEYNEMTEFQRQAYLTNELLQYSYTKLLPYFKRTAPKDSDKGLKELFNGIITSKEFLQKLENKEYPFLKVTPNYNFQDATEDNSKSLHFTNSNLQYNPNYRIFEDETTLEDIRNNSLDQLISKGKINKYVNTKFLKEYSIDLEKLFTTGVEESKTSNKDFLARQELLKIQKKSLEKVGKLGKHNLYMLPQKEQSLTRKFDIKDIKGSAKSVISEWFNFRQDESELGQQDGAITIPNDEVFKLKSSGGNSIPIFGLRELKDGKVTDDLLESYIWMNFKANEYKARVENIGDVLAIQETLLDSTFEKGIEAKATLTYKMFKNYVDFNYFGIKETASKQYTIPGTKVSFDTAKVVGNFGKLIRFRNLAYNLTIPITSAITGSVFYRISRFVGDIVDKDASNIADRVFLKHAGDASREVMNLQSKSYLNAIGERFGFYDPLDRFENAQFSKSVRLLDKSKFGAHQLANFPVNTRVGIAVLANHRFVEGNMMEYREFRNRFQGKSDKEIREIWANKISVLDVITVSNNGTVEFDYKKVSEGLNNNFTEAESKEFLDQRLGTVVKARVKNAIGAIDGAISDEDKAVMTRNVYMSFLGIHRSWLFDGIQRRFKGKHYNAQTEYIEEGIYRSTFNIFAEFIKNSKNGNILKGLQEVRKNYESYDDVTKKNVRRTLTELVLLNAMIILVVATMKELDDDDEDSWFFKVSSLFLFRTTSELSSSTVALPQQVYGMLDNLVVGLNTTDMFLDLPDLVFSDEIDSGRFSNMSERQRYVFQHLAGFKDYNNLFQDIDGNIKSQNYFSFTKNKDLQISLYPFLKEDKNK